jgi:hypothetical protein
MKKILFAFLMVGLFGFALSGCRAGAEVDPGRVSSALSR